MSKRCKEQIEGGAFASISAHLTLLETLAGVLLGVYNLAFPTKVRNGRILPLDVYIYKRADPFNLAEIPGRLHADLEPWLEV